MTTMKDEREYSSWDRMVRGRVNDLLTNFDVDVKLYVLKGADNFQLHVDKDVYTMDGEGVMTTINGMILMGQMMKDK